MKTGLDYIIEARNKQFNKAKTIELDVQHNKENQLIIASHFISHYALDTNDQETVDFLIDLSELADLGWDKEYLKKLVKKPYVERLAIAGALIAAEIDRINYNK